MTANYNSEYPQPIKLTIWQASIPQKKPENYIYILKGKPTVPLKITKGQPN